MSLLLNDFDGVLRTEIRTEDGRVGRKLSSPHREAILKRNRVTQNHGGLRQMESMGCELMIPEPDYYMLIDLFPDLKSPDSEIQTRAWHRFLANSISDPYRTSARSRKREKNTNSSIVGGL